MSRRAELGFLPAYGATQLLGFSILKAEDKETLKKQLPATKTEGYVGNAANCVISMNNHLPSYILVMNAFVISVLKE